MTGDQLASPPQARRRDQDRRRVVDIGQYTLTLHAAFNGASLSIARIESMKIAGPLLFAKSSRGETHVVRLDNIFAGTSSLERDGA